MVWAVAEGQAWCAGFSVAVKGGCDRRLFIGNQPTGYEQALIGRCFLPCGAALGMAEAALHLPRFIFAYARIHICADVASVPPCNAMQNSPRACLGVHF